jgi:hypothetical protein
MTSLRFHLDETLALVNLAAILAFVFLSSLHSVVLEYTPELIVITSIPREIFPGSRPALMLTIPVSAVLPVLLSFAWL